MTDQINEISLSNNEDNIDNNQFYKQISLIVPIFEPLELFDACLDSLLSYTEHLDYIKEVCIIDNSKSSAWDLIAKYNPQYTRNNIQLHYYRPGTNLMHVESCNLALKYCTGDWILFFNDDLEIPKSQGKWLGRMTQMFEEIPECGTATLTLIHRDNTIYWCGNPKSGPCIHIDVNKPFNFIPRDYYYDSPWSNMACLLVSKKTIDKIPFDGLAPDGKYHNHYVADHFFGLKISASGLKNVVCRDTWIYHYNARVRKK